MKIEVQPDLDLDKVEIPDLKRLKALSERLQLSPKRESVLEWQNDIKELQSEGILPTTPKAQAQDTFWKETLSPTPESTTVASCSKAKRKIDFQGNEKGNAKEKFPNVPLRRQSKSTESCSVRRNESIDTLKAKKEYFRQRSSEDCQRKIKQYALENRDESQDQEPKEATLTQRYRRIGLALERIRRDLLNMRIQDNALARQLLDKRAELLQVKAVKTCEQHATMIDDFSWELEIEEELTEQLRSSDLPSAFLRAPNSLLRSSSPLRLIGISRMTLDSKRFSVI